MTSDQIKALREIDAEITRLQAVEYDWLNRGADGDEIASIERQIGDLREDREIIEHPEWF